MMLAPSFARGHLATRSKKVKTSRKVAVARKYNKNIGQKRFYSDKSPFNQKETETFTEIDVVDTTEAVDGYYLSSIPPAARKLLVAEGVEDEEDAMYFVMANLQDISLSKKRKITYPAFSSHVDVNSVEAQMALKFFKAAHRHNAFDQAEAGLLRMYKLLNHFTHLEDDLCAVSIYGVKPEPQDRPEEYHELLQVFQDGGASFIAMGGPVVAEALGKLYLGVAHWRKTVNFLKNGTILHHFRAMRADTTGAFTITIKSGYPLSAAEKENFSATYKAKYQKATTKNMVLEFVEDKGLGNGVAITVDGTEQDYSASSSVKEARLQLKDSMWY